MGRSLFIAEKPSVAQEFAKALPYQFSRKDGFLEASEAVGSAASDIFLTRTRKIRKKRGSVASALFLYFSRAGVRIVGIGASAHFRQFPKQKKCPILERIFRKPLYKNGKMC